MVEWFRQRGVKVGHAWGMTETSPIGTIGSPPAGWDNMTDEEQVAFSVRQGRGIFGIEMRTVDDNGRVRDIDADLAVLAIPFTVLRQVDLQVELPAVNTVRGTPISPL